MGTGQTVAVDGGAEWEARVAMEELVKAPMFGRRTGGGGQVKFYR